MSRLRFLNDIIKPWDELSALLATQVALQPALSDATRLAGSLAVSIRHQVDALGLNDGKVNAECQEHRVISDVADFWKHGSLRNHERNNRFGTEAFFEYEGNRGFRFLRNALLIEHATLGTWDFLETSLVAINYWISKHGWSLNWPGSICEGPAVFHDEAFLKLDSKRCVSVDQVRLGFFFRDANGALVRVDPPEVRFAIYE